MFSGAARDSMCSPDNRIKSREALMSVIQSENSGHRATCLTAEVTRQVAVAGPSQSAVKTADLAFLKTAAKSAISSGLSPAQFLIGLRELGHFGIYDS
jgi:hypothetical protein